MLCVNPQRAIRILAALFLLAGGFAGATPGQAVVIADPPVVSAQLTLSEMSPELLQSGGQLKLVGKLTNETGAELTALQFRVRAVGARLGTRGEVARWLDGLDIREGSPVGNAQRIPQAVPAAGVANFSLTVSAASLGLPGPDFGTYPIAVEALARVGAEGTTRVGWLRTTIAAQRIKAYVPQEIAWLIPITGLPGTAVDPASSPADLVARLAHEVGPGSRLRAMLDIAGIPGVSWAVDPQLILALQTALSATASPDPNSTPSPTPSATRPPTVPPPAETTAQPRSTPAPTQQLADRAQVQSFLNELRKKSAGHDVIALPYADPDVQLLATAGSIGLLASHHAAGEAIVENALGVSALTNISWPPGGSAAPDLIQGLAQTKYQAVILDGRSRPLAAALDFTPDLRTTDLPNGFIGLLTDFELSQLATSALRGNTWSQNRFLAETTAITTERPGLTRRFLMALPRDAQLDPDGTEALIRSSAQVPWLRLVGVKALTRASLDRSDTASLARDTISLADNAPPISHVENVISLRNRLSALGQVVQRPVVTADLQRQTLHLLSGNWQGRSDAWQKEYRRQQEQVMNFTNRVSVIPTNITFLRKSGELRLTISNDLDQPVKGIRLRVVSQDRELIVSKSESASINLEAGTRATVRVPVTALASSEVKLQAEIISPQGTAISSPKSVRVRVRPTDSWAINAGGSVAVIVLAIGLFRASRNQRNRRRNRSE